MAFAVPPVSPRFAVRPTVLASEIANLSKEPEHVTVVQILDVVKRLAADVSAVSQVLVRVKTSSSAFDKRAAALESVDQRVQEVCNKQLTIIGELPHDTDVATELKQLRNVQANLKKAVDLHADRLDVELETITTSLDTFHTQLAALHGQVAEVQTTATTATNTVAEFMPRAKQAMDKVLETEQHMKWYQGQYTETHKQMEQFMNDIPLVRHMDQRMLAYIDTVNALEAKLNLMRTDLLTEIGRQRTDREKAEQGIRDNSYTMLRELLDRVGALEARLAPRPEAAVAHETPVARSADAPEEGREYVYVCEKVLKGREIIGLGNPALKTEREVGWHGIVDQVPELERVALVYPERTPLIDLVAAYRKVIPNMAFDAVCRKFVADAAFKEINVSPLTAAIFATLLLIRFLNANGQPVVPSTRVRALVRQLEKRDQMEKFSV